MTEQSTLTDGASSPSYPFSAGLAQAKAHDTVESLFGRADRALYQAKAAGRDRNSIDGSLAPINAMPKLMPTTTFEPTPGEMASGPQHSHPRATLT